MFCCDYSQLLPGQQVQLVGILEWMSAGELPDASPHCSPTRVDMWSYKKVCCIRDSKNTSIKVEISASVNDGPFGFPGINDVVLATGKVYNPDPIFRSYFFGVVLILRCSSMTVPEKQDAIRAKCDLQTTMPRVQLIHPGMDVDNGTFFLSKLVSVKRGASQNDKTSFQVSISGGDQDKLFSFNMYKKAWNNGVAWLEEALLNPTEQCRQIILANIKALRKGDGSLSITTTSYTMIAPLNEDARFGFPHPDVQDCKTAVSESANFEMPGAVDISEFLPECAQEAQATPTKQKKHTKKRERE